VTTATDRVCLGADQMAGYVDSPSIGSAEHARITAHVEACERCRAVVVAMVRATQTAPPPDPDRVVQPGDRIDRYAVFDAIGAGGMGTVYAAYDPRLDRKIALKLLAPALCSSTNRERMRREAQALAKLTHPNVVAVHDAGPWRDRFFIAMEFVSGSTLREWVTARRRTWRAVVDVLLQAAEGLVCAHEAGLVHRDVKPQNILIGADRRARIGDFGLAGMVRDPDGGGSVGTAEASLTGAGVVLGTPAYMAPEQRAAGEVGPAADQFSFCVTAYEALTGVRPVDHAVLRGTRRMPRAIARCLARGLSQAPRDRFPAMRDLVIALRGVRERSYRLAIAAAVAVVLAGSALALRAGSVEDAPPDTCPAEAAAAIASTWNARRAAELARTRGADPDDLVRAVRASFDELAATWRHARTEACRATRVFGFQSEAVLDARVACLDASRERAGVLLEELIHADALPVAPAVADALGELDRCDDLDALRSAPLGAPDVRELLDRAHAALVLDRPESGLAMIARVAAVALAPALRAELRVLEGTLLGRAGRDREAARVLEDAVYLAEGAANTRLKVRALVAAVRFATDREAREQWAGYAAAAIEASGDRAARIRLERARWDGAIADAGRWLASRIAP
jgi:eukaryotic-like serine/threonine-protein kinase